MRATLIALLCPALLSCSVWLDLDKSKLDGYPDATSDGEVEVSDDQPTDLEPDGDVPGEIPPDTPGDAPTDCPDARECDNDLDCDDGDACTTDTCDTTCGICEHEPMSGLQIGMEDFQIRDIDISSSSTVKIAQAGSLYGATWGEDLTADPGDNEIWFATFTDAGLEVSPIQLTDNSVTDREPVIDWTGSEFGIAWFVDEGGSSRKLQFERVETDGTQGGIIDVVTGVTDLGLHDMVWDGATYGLTWTQSNGGGQHVWFARLQPDGSFYVSPNQITTLAVPSTPSIAWTGSEYGVAWIDGRASGWAQSDIYFQRIATTGEEVLSEDAPVATGSFKSELPDITWSGSEYAVTWQDERDGGHSEIYFARISGDGVKNGVDKRITNEPSTQSTSPSIAHGDGHYGLGYSSNGELIFHLLDEEGAQIGGRLRVNPADQMHIGPDLLWNNDAGYMYYGVAWQTHYTDFEMFNYVKVCTVE